MRFGILLIAPHVSGNARRDFAELLEQAIAAENLGYDSVWVTEHHSPFGTVGAPAVVLGAIAARTSRVRLGSMAAILPYHRPQHTAESYALVDALSEGRLELGVGRGNLASELDLHGVDPETSREPFWENLAALRALWSGGADGRRPGSFPQPLQQPVPIWVAANSIETAQRAAGLGLRIATSPAGGDIAGYRRRMAEIGTSLIAAGLSPSDLQFPLSTFDTYIAPSVGKAQEDFREPAFTMHRLMREADRRPLAASDSTQLAARSAALGTSLVTDPAGAVSFLRDLEETTGLAHFVAATAQGGLCHELVLASMELFAREVIPVLRSGSGHMDALRRSS